MYNIVLMSLLSFFYYQGSYFFSFSPGRITISPSSEIAVSSPREGKVYFIQNGVIKEPLEGFNAPFAIAYDENGNLYVAEKHTGIIYLIHGSSISTFYKAKEPVDIVPSPYGIYVVDKRQGIIMLDYDANPIPSSWASDTFYSPFSLQFDEQNQYVYVLDKKWTKPWIRIQRFTLYGENDTLIYEVKDHISYSLAYFPDSQFLYFPDALWGKIYRFKEGAIDSFGKFGKEFTEFKVPVDIEIAQEGIFYVSNSENLRIDIFTLTPVAVRESPYISQNFSIRLLKNPSRKLSFSFYLPKSTIYEIGLFDITGRLIKVLEKGKQTKGWWTRSYSLNIPSGSYFLRMVYDKEKVMQKVVRIK